MSSLQIANGDWEVLGEKIPANANTLLGKIREQMKKLKEFAVCCEINTNRISTSLADSNYMDLNQPVQSVEFIVYQKSNSALSEGLIQAFGFELGSSTWLRPQIEMGFDHRYPDRLSFTEDLGEMTINREFTFRRRYEELLPCGTNNVETIPLRRSIRITVFSNKTSAETHSKNIESNLESCSSLSELNF